MSDEFELDAWTSTKEYKSAFLKGIVPYTWVKNNLFQHVLLVWFYFLGLDIHSMNYEGKIL